MQRISRILGLARQVMILLMLLVKLIGAIIALVNGATNYLCTMTILARSMKIQTVD
jgi:hypothetical protein